MPRPLPFLVKVLHDVGCGLLSIRTTRVVHMDLKAANVVLDWAGPDSRYHSLPHYPTTLPNTPPHYPLPHHPPLPYSHILRAHIITTMNAYHCTGEGLLVAVLCVRVCVWEV